MDMDVKSWEDLPALLTVRDLRKWFGRDASYRLAHRLGRRIGKKLYVTRDSLKRFLEREGAVHE